MEEDMIPEQIKEKRLASLFLVDDDAILGWSNPDSVTADSDFRGPFEIL